MAKKKMPGLTKAGKSQSKPITIEPAATQIDTNAATSLADAPIPLHALTVYLAKAKTVREFFYAYQAAEALEVIDDGDWDEPQQRAISDMSSTALFSMARTRAEVAYEIGMKVSVYRGLLGTADSGAWCDHRDGLLLESVYLDLQNPKLKIAAGAA